MGAHRVVIVSGGLLGTMHALEACRHGFEVVHLEADAGPRRASVRNFGLAWVSGRAGRPEFALAVRARELWEQLAGHSPAVGFRPDGSITVARYDAELALMAEAAARPDAGLRGFELLDAEQLRTVNPAVRGDLLGGLLCTRDAIVEPGLALGALRNTLETTGRYTWLPRRQVVNVETAGGGTTVAVDHLGERHEASIVVPCIGDRIGATLAPAPLRRCRLQMMQTAPVGERLTTALADADSMRYYPGFDLPGRSALPEPTTTTSEWTYSSSSYSGPPGVSPSATPTPTASPSIPRSRNTCTRTWPPGPRPFSVGACLRSSGDGPASTPGSPTAVSTTEAPSIRASRW